MRHDDDQRQHYDRQNAGNQYRRSDDKQDERYDEACSDDR